MNQTDIRTILMLVGLPGSGKTTYAKQLLADEPGRWKRINRDDLRMMNDNYLFRRGEDRKRMDQPDREMFITLESNALVKEALSSGFDVILDNTHLSGKSRRVVHQLAEAWGGSITVEERVVPIPLAEVLRRNAQRTGDACVPEEVIQDMAKRYHVQQDGTFKQICDRVVRYESRETAVLVQDTALPEAIICDLDGTLALLNGRDPYNPATCAEDQLNGPVALVLNAVRSMGRDVLLMSGREEKYRAQTVEFWQRHFPWDFDRLFMRPTGDQRKDATVKRELFEQHVRGRYYVHFVIDDRPQVVRMWRYELGLTVFQLNDKEF